MMKLYKRSGERITHYHEAWAEGSMVIEHWGTLGQRGNTREHALTSDANEEEIVQRVLASAIARGFAPIDLDDHSILIIEYSVIEMGNEEDLVKRYALDDRMNELLGWTGLGHCDGGSIGSGTMEVCCYVVDFKTAERVIKEDLAGTEFADYSRIYDEDAV